MVDFAKRLKKFDVEIISTGKTAKLLKRSGIVDVKEVSAVTEFQEILSGRVKTLHPKIFGGVLMNKRNPMHLEEGFKFDIRPVDMVVVNFYPFEKIVKDTLSHSQKLEYIDIGGPSLLRAAAKNYRNVAAVSDPDQYRKVIEEIEKNKGFISEETLFDLACAVFKKTKDYDTVIYNYFRKGDILPWELEKIRDLRYGENPHQNARLYRLNGKDLVEINKLQGKEISFNNILDFNTAYAFLRGFSNPTAVIIKHASICAVASDSKLEKAFNKAYRCDPISSFGGIIGLNKKVDKNTAKAIIKTGFKEGIIAPMYSKEALKLFSQWKNFRVVEADFTKEIEYDDVRNTYFGCLIQDLDKIDYDKDSLKVVTQKHPTEREWRDLLFSWKVVKFVRSNAIVLVKNQGTIGIGGGQPSRVGALKIAIKNSPMSTQGAVIASDGFFPKTDSIILAHKAKIKAIIQPGGSIKDKEIIDACDRYKIAMVFTNIRHFRH